MIQQFLAHSFLLAEHPVYEYLAQELLNGFENNSPQRWNVICERKEDLLSIRTQLFSLLKKKYSEAHPGEELKAWAGVSLYTPDTLVRNFALTLSHNSSDTLGSDVFKLLRNPFLDVVEQERLTRLLLLKLGYTGSDLAPLAKQILTLSDIELPRDESFFSVLMDVQKLSGSLKSISDVPDISLRTICVAYQILQRINSSFCRLQSFVRQYWTPTFLTHLEAKLENEGHFKTFLLPQRFLSEPILWVAAPEYTRDERELKNTDTYRPGNFQAQWIDALRSVLFDARKLFAEKNSREKNKSFNWWARTIIPTTPLVPEAPRAEVQVLGTQSALEFHLQTQQRLRCGRAQFLLGDINSSAWNIGRSDGSGVHALTPADFARFLEENQLEENNTAEPAAQADSTRWQNPAITRIANLHEEFKKDWRRLESFTGLISEALNQYDLSPSLRKYGITFDLVLHRFFDSETFSLGDLGLSSTLPPALSFLPGIKKAEEFCVVGIPHSPTTPSFHLRILNAVFHHLRSKQIALDPIASEQAYRGYWQSFLSRSEKTEFIIQNISQLKDFPEYAQLWCSAPIVWNTRSTEKTSESIFRRFLNKENTIEDTSWTRLLPDHRPHTVITLAVTAFEDYVECPLQFYWLNLHGVDHDHHSHLQPNRLILGKRAHAAAETFLRTLRHLLLIDESAQNKGQRWREMIATVDEQFICSQEFVSTSKELWSNALMSSLASLKLTQAQMNHAQALASELKEMLFSEELGPEKRILEAGDFSLLQQKLTREGVRRAFRKLIQSELQHIGTEPNQSFVPSVGPVFAAFLEQPIKFAITDNLHLAGRIDRVDTHPQGDTIIDYKTSKVPKTERDLVLLPSQLNTTNKLSVQGAIYSMAWSEKQAKDDPEAARGVRAFSLLRLKTLDLERNPQLRFEFEAPLKINSGIYNELHNEYAPYARELTAGRFPARPLLKTTCSTCPLNTYCPTGSVADENAL